MNPNDPNEVAREKNLEEQDKDYVTKLGSEIKDDMEIKAEEHFGDKYNENFLKDLANNKETPDLKSLAKAYADEIAKDPKKK